MPFTEAEKTKRAAIVKEVIGFAIRFTPADAWKHYRHGRFQHVTQARFFRDTAMCPEHLVRDAQVQLSAYREAARILRAAY